VPGIEGQRPQGQLAFFIYKLSNMEKPEIKLPDVLPTTPVSADPKPLPVPIEKPDTL
jgi:hypothetical protein